MVAESSMLCKVCTFGGSTLWLHKHIDTSQNHGMKNARGMHACSFSSDNVRSFSNPAFASCEYSQPYEDSYGQKAVKPSSIPTVILLRSPTALKGVMVPAAKGRDLVRSTLASRSLSHRSFTVHPAPRSSNAPVPNSAKSFTSGRAPAGAARAMDQKHGQAKSHVPATCPSQLCCICQAS